MNVERPPTRTLSRRKRYLFGMILLVVCVAIVEGALRVLTAVVPKNPLTPISQVVEDKVLGHVPNPDYPEHDANGFRNARALDGADLVVLGDSMAYGDGIPLERVWPQQLGTLTGMQAYNMGVPGYGPVQSLFMLERALDMDPQIVMEAFTSVNDLYDSFRMAYYLNDLSDLKSTDQDLVAAIDQWESRQTLQKLIEGLYNPSSRQENLVTRARRWLGANVRIYQLLHVVRRGMAASSNMAVEANRYPEDLFPAGPGLPPTLFVPRYRLAANELSDPRIREGLSVSLKAIERMSRRVAREGKCFAVVMIPSKEFAYGPGGDNPEGRASLRSSFLRGLEQERAVWNLMQEYLAGRNIPYVEVASALSQRLNRGEAMFPESGDGHPGAAGHDAIARAIATSGVCGLTPLVQ